MKATAQIFLSYAREDEEKVKDLYQELTDAGFKPWMAKKDILPGEEWELAIQKAIRRSDFFLACLSPNSVNKRGYLQKEIKDALDIWQKMLEDDIYLIPVRLEDCEVPESLRKFHWVDLFEEDGWTRLVKAIQVGIERRAEAAKPIASGSTSSDTYTAYEKPSPGKWLEEFRWWREFRRRLETLKNGLSVFWIDVERIKTEPDLRSRRKREEALKQCRQPLNELVSHIEEDSADPWISSFREVLQKYDKKIGRELRDDNFGSLDDAIGGFNQELGLASAYVDRRIDRLAGEIGKIAG